MDSTEQRCVPLRWVIPFFVGLAAVVYLTGLTVSPYEKGMGLQLLASVAIVAFFSAMIVFCWAAHKKYVGSPLLSWPGWKKWGLECLIALPIALGWMSVLSVLASLSPELRSLMDPNQLLYQPVVIAPVVYGFVAVLLAPIAEEMLYRGVCYESLRSWMGPLVAVFLQALMFGLMHPHGLHYMLMAFGSGLVFMGLRLWRKTLWSPILVHALVNTGTVVTMLVFLLSTSDDVILGVGMEDVGEGVRVTAVLPGSPAEEMGLQRGDVIIQLDGQVVSGARFIGDVVSNAEPGEEVEVMVRRDGSLESFVVELRRRRPFILW